VSIEVPDDVWKAAVILNPEVHLRWDAIPAGITGLDAGDRWVTTESSALLLVPSVIVPEERNILVNPAHPEASRIQAKKQRRWMYNARFR
jgi:RES domain-containing protein